MHNVLKRFSPRHLAIVTALVLSALFAAIGIRAQLSSTTATPLSGVVIEETLADSSQLTPVRPGEEQHGWTAWSG